jgi:hypothetical protein
MPPTNRRTASKNTGVRPKRKSVSRRIVMHRGLAQKLSGYSICNRTLRYRSEPNAPRRSARRQPAAALRRRPERCHRSNSPRGRGERISRAQTHPAPLFGESPCSRFPACAGALRTTAPQLRRCSGADPVSPGARTASFLKKKAVVAF